MAPTVPLTRASIIQEAPLSTLGDLLGDLGPDIENDLDVLLHWLQPYYPVAGTAVSEPLGRTRAAARSCLKDQAAQLEFVRLWVNSIRQQFHLQFGPVVESGDLSAILLHVGFVSKHFFSQSACLNLSRAASDLFRRGINALFVRYLLQPRLTGLLRAHLALQTDFLKNSSKNSNREALPLSTLASVGMGDMVQAVMAEITVQRIHIYVTHTAATTWDRPVLDQIRHWVKIGVYPSFVEGCFNASDASSTELVRIAHDRLIRLRICEIYDMVVAFPQSEVALHELHACLVHETDADAQTRYRSQLVDAFVACCTHQLLHLGANTEDVVVMYSKTIKAFLLVDPTGVLLDKVARPIRRYLKTRSDLVAQLVQGMLDLSPSNRLVELARELHKNMKPAVAPVDDLTDVAWVPDPIDALPDFKKGKVSDVVEALVSIFPLTTAFVDEFTRLFGERLLRWNQFSATDVIRDVELLKTRFGANEFATLDVMVKDIHDSDAINATVTRQRGTGEFMLTVLSRMYWPTVCDNLSESDNFEVPVQTQFEAYNGMYRETKKGRSLKLIPSLGLVTLDLTMLTGVRTFTVTPAQASVINVFDDEPDALTAQTVAMVTTMPEYYTTQALRFWVGQGVLREVGGKYEVDE